MADDDESSHVINQLNYNLKINDTPNSNKRFRTTSLDNETYRSSQSQEQILHNRNENEKTSNENKMTSSVHEGNFPPISLSFKNEPQATDRLMINNLIKWWKSQFKKDLNIIGRYGYKKCLLVFANDLESFDFLIQKLHWPKKIQQLEYEMKLPKVFPPDFSIVVQHFPKNWDEQEINEEVKEKYASLVKLTRLYGRNNSTLNSVRADFRSLQQVKSILQEKFICIGQMKLPVKIYYQPVRVRKCMKCFSHDHTTSSCANQRVCIRCGQQHQLDNNCQNTINCVNCNQQHYAGHPSCPVVQKKRRELAEQHKINRSKLLINASTAQYEYDNTNVSVPRGIGAAASIAPGNYLMAAKQHLNPSTEQRSSQERPVKEKEHVEQLLLALMTKIETRLSTLESTLTSQLSELEIKIDSYNDRLSALEHVAFDTLLPTIQSLIEVISAPNRTKTMKEQLALLNQTIGKVREDRKQQMNMTNNNLNIQFNNYKYTELSQQYENLNTNTSSFQLKLGLSILEEWCWTYSREEVMDKWLQQYMEPITLPISLSLLHYNIRYFYSNQYALIDMINKYKPSIISINELGTVTPQKALEKLLFSYNIFMKEGTNTHGGAVLAIDKKLKAIPIELPQENIVAVTLINRHKTFTIASIYSPPNEPLPTATLSLSKAANKNFIIVGDFNSKHASWECPQANPKGYVLDKWLDENDLTVHNPGMITSLRSDTTIDLIISTELKNQCSM
ncbi:unnamed protein product [Adineta steineri]|uniref:Endonuclease/exonuclease/phosphatase domain-containing protein n=1 Tax=Adineta steineri TaxID=433720 RepID=A0A814FB46_9BILA|nr:unnamed protein product [Adineta steineri]CAF3998810.1 unnamed protein product [Adineta steineri]